MVVEYVQLDSRSIPWPILPGHMAFEGVPQPRHQQSYEMLQELNGTSPRAESGDSQWNGENKNRYTRYTN